MNEEQKNLPFSEWKRMTFTNSKDLPRVVFVTQPDGTRLYMEYVGLGWIEVDPVDDAVEIVDG